MKSGLFKTSSHEFCLFLLILIFTFFYFSRINGDYVESAGDNYTYELLAESVFSSHPFKLNVDFNPSAPPGLNYQQQKLPPLYPVLLALAHILFGRGMPVNFYFTSLLGVLCALPVFFIGKLLWSKQVGLLSALVTLMMPALRITSIGGLNAPLFTFLSLWALYWLLAFIKKPAADKMISAGVFAGLAFLTDYTGILLAAVGVLVILKKKSEPAKSKERLIDLALFSVATILIVSPWLARNFLLFGKPLLLPGLFSGGFFAGSWSEILSHVLANVYHETGIMSLLLVYGLINGYYQEPATQTMLVYIFGSLLIAWGNFSGNAVHFVNWLPAVNILGILSLAKFYQFRRYSSLQDYFRDNFWRQAFLALSVFGIVFFGYRGYREQPEADAKSRLYPVIGNWLRRTTAAGTVIMAKPVSPIFYYARRPMVSLPDNGEQPGLLEIASEYQVEYVIALNAEQLSMIPTECEIEQKFEVGKKLALVLKMKTE